MNEAESRHKRFIESGEVCDHRYVKLKEYYLGTATGDYRCSNCFAEL